MNPGCCWPGCGSEAGGNPGPVQLCWEHHQHIDMVLAGRVEAVVRIRRESEVSFRRPVDGLEGEFEIDRVFVAAPACRADDLRVLAELPSGCDVLHVAPRAVVAVMSRWTSSSGAREARVESRAAFSSWSVAVRRAAEVIARRGIFPMVVRVYADDRVIEERFEPGPR